MPLRDYTTGNSNRILIGGSAAVGLIITAIVGVSVYTPAYQVRNSSGQVTWQVNLKGDSTQSGVLAAKSLLNCNTIDSTSTGMLVCGTDSSGGGVNTGAILNAGNDRFVNVSGDTMTGALNIRAALSGSSLFTLSGYRSCTIKTTATGMTVCGTDIDTDTTYTAAKGLTLVGTAFQMNAAMTGASLKVTGTLSGALLVLSNMRGCTLKTSGSGNVICGTDNDTTYAAGQGLTRSAGNAFSLNTTITGSLVRFLTVSGSTVFAKNLLTSSGTLTTESGAYFDGTTLVVAAGPNRVGINTATPKTALDVNGTLSGKQLFISTTANNFLQGNLGIGTGAGVNQLNVFKLGSSAFARVSTSNGASNGSFIVSNPDRAWSFAVRGDISDWFAFSDETAGAIRLVIDNNGNMGIGSADPTKAPDSKLEVTGTISGSSLAILSTSTMGGVTTFNAPAKLKGYTVSTLPAGVTGYTAYVTDALAPTFGAAVVGGGAVVIPVFYNGTSWVSY